MIIPLNVDKNEDEELITWLNSKRNRSFFIRQVLYHYKNHIENGDDNILYLDVYKSKELNNNVSHSKINLPIEKTCTDKKNEISEEIKPDENINKEDSEILDVLIDGINGL